MTHELSTYTAWVFIQSRHISLGVAKRWRCSCMSATQVGALPESHVGNAALRETNVGAAAMRQLAKVQLRGVCVCSPT